MHILVFYFNTILSTALHLTNGLVLRSCLHCGHLETWPLQSWQSQFWHCAHIKHCLGLPIQTVQLKLQWSVSIFLTSSFPNLTFIISIWSLLLYLGWFFKWSMSVLSFSLSASNAFSSICTFCSVSNWILCNCKLHSISFASRSFIITLISSSLLFVSFRIFSILALIFVSLLSANLKLWQILSSISNAFCKSSSREVRLVEAVFSDLI